MSYSIIFDTKFIKLQDGRLLHLDRSGCNNDTVGRDLSDFTGKIYTYDELQKYVISLTKQGKSDNWELKIGSRYATYHDYAKHLATMANRAKTFEEFNNERCFYASRYDGVELLDPEEKTLTADEFHQYWLDNYGKAYSYRRLTTRLNSEKEIITALENKEAVSFYVGKKHKVNKITT